MTLFIGLGTAYYQGWEKLEPRLINIYEYEDMGGRTGIFKVALEMIDDYGFFGSGPGSFESVMQFEVGESSRWESWVHNDYIETILCFGIPGTCLLLGIIGALFIAQSINLFFGHQKPLIWFVLLSLIGVAIHAVGDFPLQVYSILIIVTLITAVISTYCSTATSSDPAA
uniref:O-antigen ligase-related domain-containing protein n=1 Tax=uncultured verrucomicrobium HF0500_08N17 TaxID=723597 RepID=E7C4X6_9BACT|nr:hypothetical protein [uncultured verrucomicrobium HF0500_08N17]